MVVGVLEPIPAVIGPDVGVVQAAGGNTERRIVLKKKMLEIKRDEIIQHLNVLQ